MYDAIVVGARCAGSTTAMLLARGGYRVLLLDRAEFPSDKMSTHYIHQPTIARFARWGLLDRLRATGCPPLEKGRWELSGVSVTGCAPAVGGIRAAFGPRRYVLDSMLVDAAREAGAEFRGKCNVTDLIWNGDRVVGVTAKDASGGEFKERARVVVGADGMNSFVARQVDAKKYEEQPSLTCVYYTYWSGLKDADWEQYVNGRRCAGVVPTNDGRVLVSVIWPREEFDHVRKNIESAYFEGLSVAAPSLLERVRDAKREEPFVGTGNVPNFFRESAGHGWALVGDAGLHTDPFGGYGITDAITHAELLADHLCASLGGERPMDAALADYVAQRDEIAMPMYRANLDFATLQTPAMVLDVLRKIRDDQEQVDRFFGAVAGVIPFADFLTPEIVTQARTA